jgi:hypothetical protein
MRNGTRRGLAILGLAALCSCTGRQGAEQPQLPAADPRTGRTGDLPRWKAWDTSDDTSDKFLVLDTPAHGGMRMSSEVVTKADIIGEIDADPTAGAHGCAAYPIDAYPWGS